MFLLIKIKTNNIDFRNVTAQSKVTVLNTHCRFKRTTLATTAKEFQTSSPTGELLQPKKKELNSTEGIHLKDSMNNLPSSHPLTSKNLHNKSA
jgi:hypothetical protein